MKRGDRPPESPPFTSLLEQPRGSRRHGRGLRPALQSREQEGDRPRGLSHARGPSRPLASCFTERPHFMIVRLPRRRLEKTRCYPRECGHLWSPCRAPRSGQTASYAASCPALPETLWGQGDSATLRGWPRVPRLGRKWRNQDRNLRVLLSGLPFRRDRGDRSFQTADWM